MNKEQVLATVEPRSVKIIIGLQSMGENWGSKGLQAFDESYFTSGFIPDAFTCCFDARLVPNSDNFSPWSWVWRWFRIYFGLTNLSPSKS